MATAVGTAEPAPRRWRLRLPERLPDLKGKWLTLYTVVWASVFPLSLIGAGIAAYLVISTPTMWSPYGFAAAEDPRAADQVGAHGHSVSSERVGAGVGAGVVTAGSAPPSSR